MMKRKLKCFIATFQFQAGVCHIQLTNQVVVYVYFLLLVLPYLKVKSNLIFLLEVDTARDGV